MKRCWIARSWRMKRKETGEAHGKRWGFKQKNKKWMNLQKWSMNHEKWDFNQWILAGTPRKTFFCVGFQQKRWTPANINLFSSVMLTSIIPKSSRFTKKTQNVSGRVVLWIQFLELTFGEPVLEVGVESHPFFPSLEMDIAQLLL